MGLGSIVGKFTAAGALVAVMASGCAPGGDETEQTPTQQPGQPPSAPLPGAPVADPAAVQEWNDAMNDMATLGSKTVTPSTYGAGATPNNPPPAFKSSHKVQCKTIVNGSNSVTVDGKTRKFDVQLPNNLSSKAALLFEFSGFLQNSTKFMKEIVYDPQAGAWKPFDPNAFNIPLITVAPHSANIMPIWGLDWDIVSGEKDFPYIEGLLTCLESQFNVDTTRVYSFGFSAGAVFTNLLSAAYPKLFAATISESGVWFNDRAEWNEILFPGVGTVFMKWKWPALNPANNGAVMVTHGGPNDFATVISLENSARKAMNFLYAGGQDVTECTHEFGHTLAPDLTQAMYYQFMWDHQLGGPRQTKLSAGLPTPEKPVYNTRCNYRPAAAPAAPGVNNVVNAGFESALANWQCTGNCGFDATTLAHTGKGNGWVRNTGGWNDVHQIFSVVPNKTYKVSGWIQTTANNTDGYFGVRSASGVVGEQKFGSLPGYTQLSVTVNSGSNTNLVVYAGLWANGDTYLHVDDVSVVQQ